MPQTKKIISIKDIKAWREDLRKQGKKLVVTNGCFDILHVGHIRYLQNAKEHGDVLLIGLNSDISVRALKGSSRPINPENERAEILAALECVDGVSIFHEVNAVRFLELAKPDIYAKGADYTLEKLNQDERKMVEEFGGRIELISLTPGRSTSNMVKKIQGQTA
jgi:rfaE bifunctional protein nucleotidyltransferase chain/domain